MFAAAVSKLKSIRSLSRSAANVSWLAAERVVALAVSTVASIWVARYLGPEGFGLLSYAISFVTLFGFLSYLGLDSIVTRELVASPDRRGELMGSALAMKAAGAVVALGLVVAALFAQDAALDRQWVVLAASVGLLFDAGKVVDLWFQSQVASKYSALARSAGVVAAAGAKIILIYIGAPVVAFAAVFSAQSVVQAIGLVVAFRATGGSLSEWRPRVAVMRKFLRKGWPLIISSAGALLYLKVDQVMLGQFVGDAEVGQYAAAAKVSEMWYFVPGIIASTVFPGLVKARADRERYNQMLQRYLDLNVVLAYGVLIAVVITAGVLVPVVFGEEYVSAVGVLRIHVLAMPAVFMGAILSKWIVVEDLIVFSLTRHGWGALANVGLNLVLIPWNGAIGAAVATVASYTIAAYLSCYTDRRTRPIARMMTRALVFPLHSNPLALLLDLVRRGRRSSPPMP